MRQVKDELTALKKRHTNAIFIIGGDFNLPELGQEYSHGRIQRGGGQYVRTPLLKNHKNIGFLSNTGPDPLKITKLPSHHQHARETPYKWRFAGGPMMARL